MEPFDHGLLEAGDSQRIHWEVCGHPRGKPAVVLHGGPGSGCTPGWRRYFDPDVYRVVLFDQRGCGRSTPHASEAAADLSVNTTEHLIRDIEALRQFLGIDSWLVLGASWGSTLGLAYAERFPARVSEMVLFSVVTTSRGEVSRLERTLPRPLEDFRRRLAEADPGVREAAAAEWCEWEQALVQRRDPRYEDARFRLAFARLVTHYWANAGFVEDGALMRDAGRLAGIPGVLIHGARDAGAPLDVPRELNARWPGSRLVVVEDAGHGAAEESMRQAVVNALDGFRPGP